jgi:heptose I phosphotransferase
LSYGSLWQRWARGVDWTWINDRYRARVPEDLSLTVMGIESRDRFHSKQGRSTARVVFHQADRPLAVYLKRHFQLPWRSRLGALVNPAGRHSPAAAEWAHLERVRQLGIDVPEVVAAGEQIGPHARLSSFLMVAELTHRQALNEALPPIARELEAAAFERFKRRVIAEMARITAMLHAACAFHKDLYLCHFFVDPDRLDESESTQSACEIPGGRASVRAAFGMGSDGASPSQNHETPLRTALVSLIDLHRLGEHRILQNWWRWKDLGQLLFSTYGVEGITDKDRLRFWKRYRRLARIRWSRGHARIVRLRAARYLEHNRTPR